jgi:hypothetical protein
VLTIAHNPEDNYDHRRGPFVLERSRRSCGRTKSYVDEIVGAAGGRECRAGAGGLWEQWEELEQQWRRRIVSRVDVIGWFVRWWR